MINKIGDNKYSNNIEEDECESEVSVKIGKKKQKTGQIKSNWLRVFWLVNLSNTYARTCNPMRKSMALQASNFCNEKVISETEETNENDKSKAVFGRSKAKTV